MLECIHVGRWFHSSSGKFVKTTLNLLLINREQSHLFQIYIQEYTCFFQKDNRKDFFQWLSVSRIDERSDMGLAEASSVSSSSSYEAFKSK